MSLNERTKEQFLQDYQDVFEGDDANGCYAKDQFISDIYEYTNHSVNTWDELKVIIEEGDDDELTELHNSIMANTDLYNCPAVSINAEQIFDKHTPLSTTIVYWGTQQVDDTMSNE